MKIMNNDLNRSLVIIFAGLLLGGSCVGADELPLREEMISRKLDCYSRAMELPGLDWDAICAVGSEEVPEEDTREYIVESEDMDISEDPSRLARLDEPQEARLARLNFWPFNRNKETDEVEDEGNEENVEAREYEETLEDSYNEDETRQKSWFQLGPFFANRNPDREFEFSVDTAYWDYKWVDTSTKQEFTGMFSGATTSFTFRTRENEPIHNFFQEAFTQKSNVNRFGAEVHVRGGKVDYEATGVSADGILDWAVDGKIMIGYEIPFGDGKMFTPYTGGGYYLERRETGQTDPNGIDYSYTHYYLPLGAKLEYALNETWSIGFRGEYDFLYYGEIKAQYKDLAEEYNDLKYEMNTGYGFKLSGRLIRKNPEAFDFFIEPYLEYWKMKQSSTETLYFGSSFVANYYYPDAQTIEYGARFGIVY